MIVSQVPRVAHIASDVAGSTGWLIVVVAIVAFVVVLMLEHGYVKHGRANLRSAGKALATLLALALTAAVAPTPGFAQSNTAPTGLPDLISDPPVIWYTRNTRTLDGDLIRVMTFDGYLHNIGTGALRVSGNPQIEDGMKQQVFDGNEWTDVGSPTIKFETDDGHNHFHLMRAVDYVLWDDARSAPVTDAAKVGFCLVDTEQREEGYDAEYMIDDFNYCGVDEPDATDITMGITPGWRDVYDANVTLQWIDISDVQPGVYWTSAETDVNNEIVESNEDNNGIVFSQNSFPVDGYLARELEPQREGEPIRLKALVYGNPGTMAFVIASPPTNGTLDVPTGVDVLSDTVTYVANPGFDGDDSFTYYAHDVTSPFPWQPTMVTVSVSADSGADGEQPGDGEEPTPGLTIVDPGPQTGTMHERLDVQLELSAPEAAAAAPPRWYARDLPPGLSIDPETGAIGGTPTFDGTFESTVVAVVDDSIIEQRIDWQIDDAPLPSMISPNDFSSVSQELIRYSLGIGTVDASYEATGLPEGAGMVPNLPLLTGIPRAIGEFEIQVREILNDEVVETVTFTWTIRPSTRPAFPI